MQVERGRIFMGRLPFQDDLSASILRECCRYDVRLGVFTVIGAVSSAVFGYYDQTRKQYVDCVRLDKKLEITVCTGNISLKEGTPFVHAHITLADHHGQCYGGHLMPGTTIFAAEFCVRELLGSGFERVDDAQTGLSLWPAV